MSAVDVTLLPLSVLLGLLGGGLAGGRLGALANLRLRWLGLLGVALLAQIAAGAVSRAHGTIPAGAGVAIASEAAVGLWLVANARQHMGVERAALAITTGGWLLNFLPIVAVGAMPVSAVALRRAGMAGADVARGYLGKHVAASTASAIPRGWLALGDWIPLAPLRSVVSPGDIVMAAGLALLVAAGMRHSGDVTAGAGAAQSRPASVTLFKKRRVLSSTASPNTCAGGPSSTMTPDSR